MFNSDLTVAARLSDVSTSACTLGALVKIDLAKPIFFCDFLDFYGLTL